MAIVVPIISTWNATGVNQAIADIRAAETGMERAKNIGTGMRNVGTQMTMGITLPLLAIGKAATDVAKEFEVSMKLIQTNTGATAGEMESVEAAVIKMGKETIYSANQAATAFLELTKAGQTIDQINAGSLAATMNLAATEGMDLAYAAEIMSQAMNAYEIPAERAAEVTDILAAAALASTSTVTDLAYGLKYVASTAGVLGQPLDETATALAILNNAGLDASTAGTSLNQMLSSLVAPTAQAAKIMEEMGFSAYDASGELKPMEQLIRDLGKATEDMTGPERAEAMRKLFNIRGARAANLLLKEGAEGWAEMADKVDRSGAAADMASARMTGTAGALEQLRGSVETAGLALGEALAPVIIEVAGWLRKLADWFTNLSPTTQQWIVKIGLLVAVVGPLLIFLGMMVGAITGIVAAIGAVSGPVLGLIAFIVGIGVAIWLFVDNAKVAFNDLKNFFSKLDIGKFLREDWERTKKAVSDAWQWLKTKASEIWTAIKDFLIADWNRTKDAASRAWESVTQIVKDKWNGLREWFSTLDDRIKGAIGDLSRTLYYKGRELVQGFIDGIKSLWSSATSWLGRLVPGGRSYSVPSSGTASLYTSSLFAAPRAGGAATTPIVNITITESVDARTTAARVKRAIEGYDSGQGRPPGAPLKRTW